MIAYRGALDGIGPEHLAGFFEGWPSPPSPEAHLDILRRSAHVVLAVDETTGDVVGFVNALSDGRLAAYIPLLEVRASHRGRGIGAELVRRMTERLRHLYMVDVVCDGSVAPFYEKLGFARLAGMARRHYDRQSAPGPA